MKLTLTEAEASPETRFHPLDPPTSCLRSAHLPPNLPKDDGIARPLTNPRPSLVQTGDTMSLKSTQI